MDYFFNLSDEEILERGYKPVGWYVEFRAKKILLGEETKFEKSVREKIEEDNKHNRSFGYDATLVLTEENFEKEGKWKVIRVRPLKKLEEVD